MRRRELLAGGASLGALAAGGAIAAYGLPTDDGEEPRHDPIALEAVPATGSEAGEVTVPDEGRVTFVDIFATTCTICQSQMPELRAAYEEVGDDVTFVSVTNESQAAASDEEIADWWDEYDGAWTVARDETSEFVVHYGAATPIGVVFDADGRVRWEESGAKTAEEVLAEIERARE